MISTNFNIVLKLLINVHLHRSFSYHTLTTRYMLVPIISSIIWKRISIKDCLIKFLLSIYLEFCKHIQKFLVNSQNFSSNLKHFSQIDLIKWVLMKWPAVLVDFLFLVLDLHFYSNTSSKIWLHIYMNSMLKI